MSAPDPRPFEGPERPTPEDCARAREALLRELDAASGVDRRPEFHCGACAAWFAGARRSSAALRALTRFAPDARVDGQADIRLEGRVVAALNAGARQDRAADSIASIASTATGGRLQAPAALEGLVAENLLRLPPRAPRELDGRVARELGGTNSTRIGRQIAALERVRVPAELELRVAREFASGTRDGSGRRQVSRWTALAAGLLVSVGAISFALRGRFGNDDLGFRVVHAASVDQMGPFARGLLAGAAGWVEVPTEAVRTVPGGAAR